MSRLVVAVFCAVVCVASAIQGASACSNVVPSVLDPVVGVDLDGAADIHLTSGVALDITALLKIRSVSAVWYQPIESINNFVNFSAFDVWVDNAKHVNMKATKSGANPNGLAVVKVRIFLCDASFT